MIGVCVIVVIGVCDWCVCLVCVIGVCVLCRYRDHRRQVEQCASHDERGVESQGGGRHRAGGGGGGGRHAGHGTRGHGHLANHAFQRQRLLRPL